MEPLIRESLELPALSGDLPWPDVEAVGGWWNRRFDAEIDLVGADRAPVAGRIHFAGSVKWLGTPFDRHDLTELRRASPQIPGFDPDSTGLVVASLSGLARDVSADAVDLLWSPTEIVASWRS